MKKMMYALIIISALFLTKTVCAKSFTASITGNNDFSSEITLNLQVNDLDGFTGACNGLCGFTGVLNYDNTKISLESISSLNGFDLTQGSTIVLFKSTGVTSGTNILQMKFKNVSLKKDETATISFTNINGSDGDSDVTTTNVTKTIKYIVANTDTTNKDKITPKTETVTKEVKSSNNYLSSIELSSGEVLFDKEVLNYDVMLYDKDITSITVTSVAEDAKATITGNDTYQIEDSKIVKLVVKAEDGTERIYTLNIVKDTEDNINYENEVTTPTVKNNNKLLIGCGIGTVLVIGLAAFFLTKKH